MVDVMLDKFATGDAVLDKQIRELLIQEQIISIVNTMSNPENRKRNLENAAVILNELKIGIRSSSKIPEDKKKLLLEYLERRLDVVQPKEKVDYVEALEILKRVFQRVLKKNQ